MSLYGINAYTSNLYYSSLLSGAGSNAKKNTASSTTDLQNLMKQVDNVRSQKYRKSMLEEYKKAFSATETGTVESEKVLSNTAKDLNSSASALASADNSLFDDPEKLAKGVADFVEDYNSTIDAMKSSDSVDALRKGVYMTQTARAYSRALSKVGISVGSDNKLTLDKDKLAAADKNSVKSIMRGSYSFAAKTAERSGDISRAAGLKAVTTYTRNGLLENSFNNANSAYAFFSNLI